MSDFSDFESAIISGAKGLAQGTLTGFVTEAENDAKSFLTQAAADLQQWTSQLQAGQLTQDDFTDLVNGDKDLARLDALTQAGIALAEVQRFRDALINLVINAAFTAFLPK